MKDKESKLEEIEDSHTKTEGSGDYVTVMVIR